MNRTPTVDSHPRLELCRPLRDFSELQVVRGIFERRPAR
jgi:hypothetical protein